MCVVCVFWKCLIPAKNSNTYAVCSCLHTVAESCRLMYCSIWIWLQNCPWSCRAMNSASFDVCCLCFWKCLIVAKNSNTYAVCSCLYTVAESCRLMYCSIWIWLQNCPWSCRAMNSASFDVCCLCFWKCLIPAKISNTYAVCSCLHTVAESCRLMYCSIWIWLQNCPWSCRAMNSASFDVCCLCFWKCLIPAKISNTYAVCSCLHTVAESCRLMYCSIWIWLQNCPWSCRAMNSASFDVCCLCFWKCLIPAKNSNTYAVCSWRHTVAESSRFMYCSIWIWL